MREKEEQRNDANDALRRVQREESEATLDWENVHSALQTLKVVSLNKERTKRVFTIVQSSFTIILAIVV